MAHDPRAGQGWRSTRAALARQPKKMRMHGCASYVKRHGRHARCASSPLLLCTHACIMLVMARPRTDPTRLLLHLQQTRVSRLLHLQQRVLHKALGNRCSRALSMRVCAAGHNASAASVIVACHCPLCVTPGPGRGGAPSPRVCTLEAWWEHATGRKFSFPDDGSLSDDAVDRIASDICYTNTKTTDCNGGEVKVRDRRVPDVGAGVLGGGEGGTCVACVALAGQVQGFGWTGAGLLHTRPKQALTRHAWPSHAVPSAWI